MNLFFPKVCYACHELLTDNERNICTDCRHRLPVTNYHFEPDNPVEKVFYGRTPIMHGTALFTFYKKGPVQQLLHNLKYRGHETIGITLGRWLGHELKTVDAYQNIDIVIPVPLYKKRLRKRGYNQVARFGEEIASAIGAHYADDILIKTSATNTQVFKERLARWYDRDGIFSLKNSARIKGKHILLVDDIITTGATIEACANVLQKAGNVKISVATMAIAG